MQQGHCIGQKFPLVSAELSGNVAIVQMLWVKEKAKKACGIEVVTLHIPQLPGFLAPGCCRALGSADKIFSPQIGCAEVNGSSLMVIIFAYNWYG